MHSVSNMMLALALAGKAIPAQPVDPMAVPLRNLFYEGADIPMTQRFAERLLAGQGKVDIEAFQKQIKPVREDWRGYEFGA